MGATTATEGGQHRIDQATGERQQSGGQWPWTFADHAWLEWVGNDVDLATHGAELFAAVFQGWPYNVVNLSVKHP